MDIPLTSRNETPAGCIGETHASGLMDEEYR